MAKLKKRMNNGKNVIFISIILTVLVFSAYTIGLLTWTNFYTFSLKDFPRVLIKKEAAKQEAVCKQYVVNQTQLPFDINFLTNPTITQWRVGVEGKLIKKDQSSFTIDQNGTQLTIGFDNHFTSFNFNPLGQEGSSRSINFSDLPIGSYLIGGITIYPKLGKEGSNVVGDLFSVISKTP